MAHTVSICLLGLSLCYAPFRRSHTDSMEMKKKNRVFLFWRASDHGQNVPEKLELGESNY